MKADVMILAGGTGGHIFPALSTAKMLRDHGYTVAWLGTESGMESKLVPREDFPFFTIHIKNLRGKGPLRLFMLPFRLFFAVIQARKILKNSKVKLVVGFGGYVSGPGALAAKLLCLPLIIHEQNAIPGLTNRWLSKIADSVLMGFPSSFPGLKKAMYTGNPIRSSLYSLANTPYQLHMPLQILVMGGSLGAEVFNTTIPLAFSKIPAEQRPILWQQTGEKGFIETQKRFKALKIKAKITPFIDNMNEAYAWADLIICRSGALTVSELTKLGKPAILIPLPTAADDHQRKNAEILTEKKAAILILQKELTAESLAHYLIECVAYPDHLVKMAKQMKTLTPPDSTKMVVSICEDLLSKS